MLLTFFDMSARTHYLNARQTLRKLLDWRIVPVINENDTTTTDEISFGDNDFLAAQVAVLVGADLLVLLTDTDGLYTADPRERPGGAARRGGHRLRGARGLRDRPRDLAARARAGCARRSWPPRWRRRPGSRRSSPAACARARSRARCAASRTGTRFPPRATRYSCFKLWLRYAKPPPGTVSVDAGAARALREGGTSLLPVGIVGVEGGFDAGDAVEVRRRRRAAIGKGICNYSAAELRQVKGLKTAAGARAAPARDRGGRPPRLLRARLRLAAYPFAMADHDRDPSPTSACARQGRAPRRARARSTPRPRTRALLAIADALDARAPRDPRGQRARPRGRPRARASTPRCSTGSRSTRRRVAAIADGARAIAALPDPVGEVIEGGRLPNGLDVRKVRVPLGVVAVVYEARPNVTIDAAALCLKSGNAIVLRGSSSAAHSNAVLAAVAREAARGAGVPDGRDRRSSPAAGARSSPSSRRQEGVVDLIIPRGGEGLKKALKAVATVPVIYAASGNCHVYVDASADLDAAERDRRQRQDPAARRLQRGRDAARARATPRPTFLPRALRRAARRGRRAARRRARARAGRATGDGCATRPTRTGTTSSSRSCSRCGVVDSARRGDRARQRARLRPLRGDRHRRDTAAARAFQRGVDAACVYVNASTRFTDGGEFGMGAEIGNSTQKLHARGPIGVRELCTYKYVVEGDGHIRGRSRRARRDPRRDVQPAAPRPPGLRAGGAATQLGLDRVAARCRSPRRRTRRSPTTRARRCRSRCAGSRSRGDERLEVSRARGRPRRAVVHGRYPAGAA